MNGRTNSTSSTVDVMEVPLDPCTNFIVAPGDSQVTLIWTDPKDKYATPEGEQAQDPQQLVSKWAYTKIVRKVGSAPTGPNDGVAVVSSEVRNAYQTNPFVDTGVENDVTYYYAAYAYNESYVASASAVSNDVTPKEIVIYGVEWNGTDTTKWTRIGASADFSDPSPAIANGEGSSPFDNRMPWAGMVVSEDPEVGTVVAIPKFWYKWTALNPGLRLEISDAPQEGFHVSPAHMDRGDGKGERDVVYVGRYIINSDYKSLTGKKPHINQPLKSYRTLIHKNGDTVWQWDWAILNTIWMLYLVEFADWDSQATIGYGCGNNEYGVSGYTDSMPYHTGTNLADRTTYGLGTQYRNIEGLWDNISCYVDGVLYEYARLNVCLNPSYFDNSGNEHYEEVFDRPSDGTIDGRPSKLGISSVSGFEWVVHPTETNGSDTTFVPDIWRAGLAKDGNAGVKVGGYRGGALYYGLFRVDTQDTENATNAGISSRLMVLP